MPTAVSTYGYIHAKLRTRIGQITQESLMNTLIEAPSMEEAIRILEGTTFQPLAQGWQESGNIRMGELALLSQEVSLFRKIQQQLPPSIQPFMRALLRQYEIQQVKEIVRHWFHLYLEKHDHSESSGYLFRDQVIHTFPIEAIMESDTLSSMAQHFPREYQALIESEGSRIESDRSLYTLERALDVYYYKQVLEAAKSLSFSDKTLAEKHLYEEIDLSNVETLYRLLKQYGQSGKDPVEQLIPFGRVYRQRSRLQGVDQADGLVEVVKPLLPFFQGDLGKSLEQDSLREEYLRERMPKFLGGNPFSLAIILSYVQLKRWENRRVVRVIHAKYYGLSTTAIREML